MKKGVWQQQTNDHRKMYGNSFMSTKEFHLKVDEKFINLYLKSNAGEDKDIYKFGVYTGGTMRDTIKQFESHHITFNKAWGFDSFEGLPKETEGMRTEGKHWNEGAFSASDALKTWDWDALHEMIMKKINSDKAELIKGYYDDVLDEKLVHEKQFKPALFVNIYVDLYKSTIDALDWMFKHNLIIKGTLIRYDDVNFVPETTGELQAHKEMCEKYNITCKKLNKQYYLVI
jgi:hypothetical protein